MDDRFQKARAVLSFLSDLGGALLLVVAAAGFITAAVVGAALLLWTTIPQPYLTFLVVGIALLVAGITLHLLRERLAPPRRPISPVPADTGKAAQNPYSQANALQARHEADAKAKAEAEERAAAKKSAAELRRALRRVREELLDNDHAVTRSENVLDQLLNIRFTVWNADQATLLDATDPEPHELASEAYRQIRGLLTGRVREDDFGNSFATGSRPMSSEVIPVRRAIDKAVHALQDRPPET